MTDKFYVTGSQEQNMLIDDFSGPSASGFPASAWRFEPASPEGEGSRERIKRLTRVGIPLLWMTGEASSDQDAELTRASLDLSDKSASFDASAFGGVRLAVKGNGKPFSIELRTPACQEPQQFYQALIQTNSAWRIVTLPFESFLPKGLEAPLDPSQLREISLALSGGSSRIDLTVARMLFYKGQRVEPKALSAAETAIIVHRDTERAFSGKYDQFGGEGVYDCKRCGSALFRSSNKFDSGCGWPSFDRVIAGAVLILPDDDGRRTEIVCAACGAHLGHVFVGEGLTANNTRHCVNSLSLEFAAKTADDPVALEKPAEERAIFASGCFWGTEYHFQRKPGVLKTTVGYTGGQKKNPTYQEVCTGTTGHAEAVEVLFDPSKVSYEELARLYFETHDFTQLNGQGPDIGTQYRGEIFYLSEEQKKTAEALLDTLKKKGYQPATRLTPASKFWPGENYHQDYYQKNGESPYCHIYRKVF